jgi:6-phosphogluconolactonase
MSDFLVYIGTYTRGQSQGIYVYRLDMKSGALSHLSTAPGVENPSFLDIAPNRRFLYAVGEVGQFQGQPGGAVSAFAINQKSGALSYLNTQSTVGTGPCHLSVERRGRYVLVANYGGGSVAMLPIQKSGRLSKASAFVQHQGSSVNPRRQEGPHAHAIVVSPDNRYAFSPDLGLDQILIYKMDLKKGKLLPGRQPFARVQAGQGPRHFEFHPRGKYAYVINEIGNTITVFDYDAQKGTLIEVQSVPTLPPGFGEVSHTADIHVHPSGRFLYGSNRGHDSLVICSIEGRTGKLAVLGHESTQGKVPRNFAIDPTGTYALAANQDTDTVVTFRIDRRTGQLKPTGHVAQVPTPVCLKLIPVFA